MTDKASKGGRPPTKRVLTPEQEIGQLRACGFNEIEIAEALRIPVKELRSRYADALDHGASRARAELLSAMYGAGLTGNSASGKAWWAITAFDGRPQWEKRRKREAEATQRALADDDDENTKSWNDLLSGKFSEEQMRGRK